MCLGCIHCIVPVRRTEEDSSSGWKRNHMNIWLATDIAHPIGFLAGSVVYALLLAMVLQASGGVRLARRLTEGSWHQRIRPPLYIAVLGLCWNLASLAALLVAELRGGAAPALLALLATSALGGLPAVVLHSVWQTADGAVRRLVGGLTVAGYGLSATVVTWNVLALSSGNPVPASGAWWSLIIGFLVLFVSLLWVTKRTLVGHGGLVLVFLAVCSVVALPLSHHPDGSLPWWFDFLGHQASLPVAMAVLYRDYRFAFVDHFLKHTVSFLLLVGVSFGLYVTVLLPSLQTTGGLSISPAFSGLVVSLWALTALSYPWLHRSVTRLFDTFLLHRPDCQGLRNQLAQRVNEQNTFESVLAELCRSLERALRSRKVSWEHVAGIPQLPSLSETSRTHDTPAIFDRADVTEPVQTRAGGLSIVIPMMDGPRCVLTIAPCHDGRRFLSEDLTLLEAAVLIAARRIDAMRTSHERCELALREQEMQKLTTEAELRALRAQINPHFLFNALNTIGYLIEAAPDRAVNTLKDLTGLLRGILRRMDGNFTTLGEELELVRSYLDIEQARFEERLIVRIDVPDAALALQVPALVLQPIVENAVKHGIQPSLDGGVITIVGRILPDLQRHTGHSCSIQLLSLEICDTGAGATEDQLQRGRRNGIGMKNVELRLRGHYGDEASVRMVSEPGVGTTVELRMPAREAAQPTVVPVVMATGQRK